MSSAVSLREMQPPSTQNASATLFAPVPGTQTRRNVSRRDEADPRKNTRFDAIVGNSPAICRMLKWIETVAPTDSTVLIEGETGTGKELVGRAIHDCSKRSNRPFVKLNCAALPAGLLESELFGHEKGAFTGAVMRKPGRFQMAHQGTLFLDEIGDMPFEVQAKLLRVLQEGEFEMLGSNVTHKVDVRLVAATNANLQKMIVERKFREDLYYRINVLPIAAPPLRQRRGDIPILIRHFVSVFAEQMGKQIDDIPPMVMQAMVEYAWPGNVRELQNLIERSVILSSGRTLEVPLKSSTRAVGADTKPQPVTLEDAEREHITKMLERTGGVIAGPNGAAAQLGLKRSTLYFMMRKLGIRTRSEIYRSGLRNQYPGDVPVRDPGELERL
jgi:formate hydrogenlyase transcriptional activator